MKRRTRKPRGNGQRNNVVRPRPVSKWVEDPNLDGPATQDEVDEAEGVEFERLMQEPPLGIEPLGIIRGRRR